MFMQILSDFFITLCKSIVSFMFMLYANKASRLHFQSIGHWKNQWVLFCGSFNKSFLTLLNWVNFSWWKGWKKGKGELMISRREEWPCGLFCVHWSSQGTFFIHVSVCLNYHAREFDKSHKREGKPLAKIQDGIDLVLHAILTSTPWNLFKNDYWSRTLKYFLSFLGLTQNSYFIRLG